MRRRVLSFIFSVLIVLIMTMPAFADVSATDMRHSVVYVEVGCQGEAGFEGIARGSGFFVGEEGEDPSYIVTNYHVIDSFIQLGKGEEQTSDSFSTFATWYIVNIEGISSADFSSMSEDDQTTLRQEVYDIWVKFAGNNTDNSFRSLIRIYYDDRDFDEAFLVESGDSDKDMALLRLDKATDKRVPLTVREPSEDIVGHSVTAIGFPASSSSAFTTVSEKGENDSTVTKGTVSKLSTESGTGLRVVQYDASITNGNSGGPLILDEDGSVVAINTWATSVDSNMFFGVSMTEVVPMLDRNNVKYDKSGGVTTTSTSTTSTSSTSTTTTTTETAGITIFGYTFTYTQVILGIIGLIALIVIIVLVIRHLRRPKPDLDGSDVVLDDNGPGPDNDVTVPFNGGNQAPLSPPVPPASPADPDDSLFRVQCVSGSLGSRRFRIPRTGEVVMGRNEGSGIKFPSNTKGVSGRHCAVYYDSGSVYIKDIGSSFGTFIEPGRRLTANESVMIPVGRKFWLGSENECFVIDRKK